MIKFFIILLILLGLIAIVHFTFTLIYFPSNSKSIRKEVLETSIKFLSDLQSFREEFGENIAFIKQQLSVTYIKKNPQKAECEVLVKSESKKLVIRVHLSFDEIKKEWLVVHHEDVTSDYIN